MIRRVTPFFAGAIVFQGKILPFFIRCCFFTHILGAESDFAGNFA